MHARIAKTAAVAAEGFAAWKALPAASATLDGVKFGLPFTALAAIAIFYTWNLLFTTKSTAQRIGLSLLALFVLIPLSVASIHAASNLPEKQRIATERAEKQAQLDYAYTTAVKSRQDEIKRLDAAWQQQEDVRIASLEQINKEIKATKKNKQPEIYQQLLDRQTFLSSVTPSPRYPDSPIKGALPPVPDKPLFSDLTALQSLVFSIMTPVLLWLASIMPQSKKKPSSVHTWITTLFNSDQKNSDQSDDQTYPTKTVGNNKIEPSESTQVGNDFEARLVPCDPRFGVTLGIIEEHFATTNRNARTLRDDALKSGFLVKRKNKYFYPAKKTVRCRAKNQNVVALVRIK